jgi:branched-chain amino acid aminotransferase
MYFLDLPFSTDEITEAVRELIRRNGLRDCYIRPLAFRGYGEMGLYAKTAPVELVIAVWPWGAYLGEAGKEYGIRAKVSSWRRISSSGLIPHAKASGQYLNSILAKTESANAGYEEAILLDERGFVCEGSGENIFVVKNGKVVTPPQVASILDGITRKSVMQILEDNGFSVLERDIARSELYTADEVFMCGTAAEVVPVREVDDHPLGDPGEVTKMVQSRYEDAIYGRAPEYHEWLDLVGESESAAEPSKVET